MIKIADPIIKDEEINAVVEVLKSGRIARGKKVSEFENRWEKYTGIKHAIATNSGTAALHTTLLACGVGYGDEVIVPAFSFFSTASMISACMAKPVFTDVNRDGSMKVSDVEKLITTDTKAVIVVNLYGKLARDIVGIEKLCQDFDIPLIVDSCQYPTKKGAEYGIVSCFSFYATKNITTGEGGMITTNNDGINICAREIIDHGQSKKYWHTSLGYNYRMTDISAAMGVEQIKRIDTINNRRIEIAKIYNDELKISTIDKPLLYDHIFHQYAITHQKRDNLMTFLKKHRIETAVHYPIPIPYQPLYRKHYHHIKFPTAESLSREVLSIPCHPGLLDEDAMFVAEKINEFGGYK